MKRLEKKAKVFMRLTDTLYKPKEYRMNLNEIRRSETDVNYWKDKTMYWWKRYLKNVKLIAGLRRQNRQIRLLLSDYVNEEKKRWNHDV